MSWLVQNVAGLPWYNWTFSLSTSLKIAVPAIHSLGRLASASDFGMGYFFARITWAWRQSVASAAISGCFLNGEVSGNRSVIDGSILVKAAWKSLRKVCSFWGEN